MQEAFFTKDNLKSYKHMVSINTGHCDNCNKPIYAKLLYCSACMYILKANGLEQDRVKIGAVGRDTVNYQQYLHTKFFGCNAPVAYRGLRENRLPNHIQELTIKKAIIKLNKLLSSETYRYHNKKYTYPPRHRDIYSQIITVRNITRRLLYNILLYHISFHITNNKEFRTTMHFQASMFQNIFINMENTHVRVNKGNIMYAQKERKQYRTKFYYHILENVNKIIQPLLSEMYKKD